MVGDSFRSSTRVVTAHARETLDKRSHLGNITHIRTLVSVGYAIQGCEGVQCAFLMREDRNWGPIGRKTEPAPAPVGARVPMS